ncbi:MAG TPA: hypothetical protein VL173_02065 [Vicinamibacterales bacterium]|nr:hypothetical protein [Vicinamibacterales bacterium]
MAGVATLIGATLAPVLLGWASPHWDGLDFFGPYQILVGDYARSGRFLLWNPFTSFGAPSGIDPQIGAFSPLVTLFGVLFGGSRYGFETYWLVMWLLGPLALLRFARYLGAPAWGAYVAAVAWGMSGFYTGHAEHTAWISSMSFLPLILWRLDVAVTQGRPESRPLCGALEQGAPGGCPLRARIWPAVEAGALFGLSALAGYPGLIFLNGCFAAGWALCRSRGLRGGLVWSAGCVAVMALIALVILSPSYLAFLIEGRGYSHRTGALPFEVAVRNNALHPLALATLTSPAFSLADAYVYTDISMRSLYVGTVIPVLAAMALADGRGQFRWLLLLAAIAFGAAALGVALPVRGWLYDIVPPTRYFRNTAMFRGYAMFALALLALLGSIDLQALLDRPATGRAARAFLVGAMAAAIALGVWLGARLLLPKLAAAGGVTGLLHPFVAWSGIIVLCITGALAFPRVRRSVPIALVVIASADMAVSGFATRSVIYGPVSGAWENAAARHVSNPDLTRRGLAREADNGANLTLIAKVPAASGYAPLTGPLVAEYLREPVLLDAASGADRLWFSPAVIETARTLSCLTALRAAAARLGAPPLTIQRPVMNTTATDTSEPGQGCPADINAASAAQRLTGAGVQLIAYTPEHLRLRVLVDQAGWLLVTDSWSRGWTATVNGTPTDIAVGNFLFRAVRVAAGANTIDFRYRLFGYPWLVIVSWMTLAVVGVASVRRRSRSRRAERADQNGATEKPRTS